MATFVLNESGYTFQMDWDDYCKVVAQWGDDPSSWSSNPDDFTFYSLEYADSDPNLADDAKSARANGWVAHFPLWQYNG